MWYQLSRGWESELNIEYSSSGPPPSDLITALPWARAALHEPGDDPMDFPRWIGPLDLRLADDSRIVFYNGPVGRMPLACTTCGMLGGQLLVDGPDTWYSCADGHDTRDRRLSCTAAGRAIVAVLEGRMTRDLIRDVLLPGFGWSPETDLVPELQREQREHALFVDDGRLAAVDEALAAQVRDED